MHGVEAVSLFQEVGRGLGGATDARELRHLVRLHVQLPERLDDRGRDRVVAAARAERADRALIVAAGQADRVRLQRRVVDLGLLDVAHAALRIRSLTPEITWMALMGNPA